MTAVPLDTLRLVVVDSPLGQLTLAASDRGLAALLFDVPGDRWLAALAARIGASAASPAASAILDETRVRLDRYFAGEIRALEGLPVDPGGTPFQARVWAALCSIPAGRTISYRELAAAVGQPAAVRAVGAANGQNPVPLVVPCHRVIGASGKLVGYGGGLERKVWLLRHEKALL